MWTEDAGVGVTGLAGRPAAVPLIFRAGAAAEGAAGGGARAEAGAVPVVRRAPGGTYALGARWTPEYLHISHAVTGKRLLTSPLRPWHFLPQPGSSPPQRASWLRFAAHEYTLVHRQCPTHAHDFICQPRSFLLPLLKVGSALFQLGGVQLFLVVRSSSKQPRVGFKLIPGDVGRRSIESKSLGVFRKSVARFLCAVGSSRYRSIGRPRL
jgi:hypothetical protein